MIGSWMTPAVAVAGLGWGILAALPGVRRRLPVAWEHPLGVGGVLALAWGNALGLSWAPTERFMGEAVRILYVHVPAAWIAMLAFLVAAGSALAYLFTGRRGFDSGVEAAAEVGVLQAVLLLVLGAIFARPTWGVWWSWDPRLTSSAVMVLSFVGVLLLRSVLLDSERRATWSAVATILAVISVPITYLSIRWRSIHAVPTETMGGSSMDPQMRWLLYLNAWAFLFVTVWFVVQRWRLAEARAEAAAPEALPAS